MFILYAIYITDGYYGFDSGSTTSHVVYLPSIRCGAYFRMFLAFCLCLSIALDLFQLFISVSYEESLAANTGVEWRHCSDSPPLPT